MTFDLTDPATWPEDLQGVAPDELRKLADALTCAVMAIGEGVSSRIGVDVDRRVLLLAARALADMRSDDNPTDQ